MKVERDEAFWEKLNEDLAVIFQSHERFIKNSKEDWQFNVTGITEKIESFCKSGIERRRFVNPDWSEEKKALYGEIAEGYIARAGLMAAISGNDILRRKY